MPGWDQTGPRGQGPRTGRGLGICPPADVPGDVAPVYGAGRGGLPWGGGRGRCFGGGRGMGRGWRGRFWQQPVVPSVQAGSGAPPSTASPEQERAALKAQADRLEGMLNDIRSRLAEIDAPEPPSEAR